MFSYVESVKLPYVYNYTGTRQLRVFHMIEIKRSLQCEYTRHTVLME